MRQILSKLIPKPTIPHLRIQFPIKPKVTESFLNELNQISPKSPAIFVSINGITQNPQISNTLHNGLKYISERKKVPLYSFLEDNINGLGYFVATAGRHISANPFCRIGDLTAPTKSYFNIHKLLEYFGIEYNKLGTKSTEVWNARAIPTEEEKQFTRRWLQLVKDKLKNQISIRRELKPQAIQQFGNKLLHPKKALQYKLIDKICTLDEYKEVYFPNFKLREFNFASKSKSPTFNHREIQVLTQMVQWMCMPKIALMAIEDPINDYIKQFVEIIQLRLEEPEKLEELDILAGRLLGNLEMRLQNINKLAV